MGKQAWRLAMLPKSLIEQIIKARYHPHTTFMEVELGSSPSYTWRRIWEAMWLLRRGVRCRVWIGEKCSNMD